MDIFSFRLQRKRKPLQINTLRVHQGKTKLYITKLPQNTQNKSYPVTRAHNKDENLQLPLFFFFLSFFPPSDGLRRARAISLLAFWAVNIHWLWRPSEHHRAIVVSHPSCESGTESSQCEPCPKELQATCRPSLPASPCQPPGGFSSFQTSSHVRSAALVQKDGEEKAM